MQLVNIFGIYIDLPVWFLLLCIAVTSYYIYMTWYFNVFQKIGIPYMKPVPILGSMHVFMKEGCLKFERAVLRNGRVAGAFFFRQPQMIISDPAILKQVLVKVFHNFTNRTSIFPPDADDVVAHMMGMAKDEKWKSIRNTMTPTFSAGKLKQMTKQINCCADQMLRHLMNDSQSKTGFNFKTVAGNFTMDVIASTGFGIQLDSHSESQSEFVANAKTMTTFSFASKFAVIGFFFPFLLNSLSKLGLVTLLPKKESEFFLRVVRQAIEQRDKLGKDTPTDLLQLMLNAHKLPDEDEISNHSEDTVPKPAKKKMTEQEVFAQALMMFLTGYDTVSNTFSYVAYCLATNPECQERATQEIQEVIGDRDTISYEDVAKLKYLQQTIDETLRLYPNGFRFDRVAKETIIIDGLTIPKDMTVVIPALTIHHDPEFYADPETFDPGRFTDEEKSKRDPFTYLPFGSGPRSCIAMRLALLQLKLGVAKILQKYKFALCPETQIPLKLNAMQNIPEHGWWVKLVEHGG